LKCYKHPGVDAVGVCSECGKGICDKCAVEIGGKLYCKSDADKVFGAPKAKAPTPAPTVAFKVTAPPATPAFVKEEEVYYGGKWVPASKAPPRSSGAGALPFVGIIFCIIGWTGLLFPWLFYLLAIVAGEVALKRWARTRLDILMCYFPIAAGALLLVWWLFGFINIISLIESLG